MASFTPQQIEQFLQEFFDVVGTRQYIGARYVPIFGRKDEDTVEWDNLAPYEPLSVVMHEGVSYVSKQYVPTGIDITNTDYWVETYRFNAQVEQYRQEVLSFQGQIDDIRSDMESDYVPFPDSLVFPKYGTLGQVLTTLADGSTKWENPVVPSDAQAEAIITEWLNDHPEATTTVQDGAITDQKIASNSSIMVKRQTLTPTDYNDITTTGIYQINANTADNAPSTRSGTLIVFAFSTSIICQIFAENTSGSTGAYHIRKKWSATWTTWDQLVATTELANYMKSFGDRNLINDANDAELNRIYAFQSTTCTNLPTGITSGTLVCISGWGSSVVFQLFMSSTSPTVEAKFYSRAKWSTYWSPWVRYVSDETITNQIETSNYNILSAFDTIVCCGDSLTSSQVYTSASTSRTAYRRYPTVLGGLCGTPTIKQFSHGGYSATDWWDNFASEIAPETNGLAIIYLGTNQGLTDTLATDCPIGTTYDTWANTNTGNYAKIVDRYIAAGLKVLLIPVYTIRTDAETINSVITQIADRFKCGLIDENVQLGEIYRKSPDGQHTDSIHYNDLGYAAFANYLIHKVSKMNATYMQNIIPT